MAVAVFEVVEEHRGDKIKCDHCGAEIYWVFINKDDETKTKRCSTCFLANQNIRLSATEGQDDSRQI